MRMCFPSIRWLTAAVCAFGLLASRESRVCGQDVKGPLSPADALAQFRLDPELRIELVAAEPDVLDPVAAAFDENGRLWVVEMGDYPNGPAPGKLPDGRIRILDDRDGDGRYERNTIFAEHLLFANGVLPWRKGAIVTDAPSILYLEDIDGDGKADRSERLYEGFTARNPQLRVSHPNLGLDNWIEVANGLRGGSIIRSGQPGARPIDLSGMDFRFDMLHDRAEAISGMGQFGLTFDDWGRRFVCDNRHHLRHVVLPNRYIKRNPYLAVPSVVQDTSELSEGEGGAGARLYPLSKNWTTSSLHTGHFTAACGVFLYRGELLPASYRGAAFTCDPTGNLVHEEILTPDGATFQSRPAHEKREFLASPDDWFRPVSMTLGPEGALYVVDMYRAVIEHPEFMPTELKNRPDLTLGKDRGRIWRIVPRGYSAPGPRPRLRDATTTELVKLLAHPSAWWRTAAQRLLLERLEGETIDLLTDVVDLSDRPLARVHAAWLLRSAGALPDPLVIKLLNDAHPRVREHAVRLAEPFLATSQPIQKRVLSLAKDNDARVRFQVALSLGEWPDGPILEPLAEIAFAGAEDHWTRSAVCSSVPRRAGALIELVLKRLLHDDGALTASQRAIVQELAAVVGGRRDEDEMTKLIDTLLALSGAGGRAAEMAGINGLAEGMARRGSSLAGFLKDRPALAERMEALFAAAANTATDPRASLTERVNAIRLLAQSSSQSIIDKLARLMADDPTQEIRLAAVRALAAHSGDEITRRLLTSWRQSTPAVRRELLAAMLRDSARSLALLEEIEAGRVAPGDVDAIARKQLLSARDPAVRTRAQKVLEASQPQERKAVLERYQPAIAMPGDAARGRQVFQKNCATCHEVAGVGVRVGPDIADTRVKSREALLIDILNPNQAIDGNYINYLISTRSGNVLNGLIAAETASSITLRRAENQTETVLRQDIEEMRSTGMSLMPEGLEKSITVAEMADLLTFLKDWRYLDGAVPLGEPRAKP